MAAGVAESGTPMTTSASAGASLASSAPCSSGFCDPVVVYDQMANRWMIAELPSSGGNVCVYVSTTPDPTGTWFAYAFPVESYSPSSTTER